ncbi:MAG: alpha/beta hydrolase [Gammaproteobacteria bacterium]|nr:alpha/beta hydrolase [Gammaproteobacteria bacterium]
MITRHFATLEGRWGPRQVHYRRAGSGPALIMLHQSPQSSADLLPLIERWQQHFTIIAPDTPGYGCSDPLGVAEASMEDFAAGVLELMDVLGLRRAGVYGFHTGGSMAVALSRLAPERITACAVNGLATLTDDERIDILEHYLPPLEVHWDGSHLTWLWARLRDQYVFFPWYRRTLDARLDMDSPAPEFVQKALVEMLRAGDHYRVAYRAAFTFPGGPALRDTTVPTLVTASAHDPLSAHQARIDSPAACVQIKVSADPVAATDACLALLQRLPGDAAPPPVETSPIEGRLWHTMVAVEGGQLRAKCNTDAAGRPVLVQHDAAGSSDIVAGVARSLIGRRPVLALDLPGHGESDNPLGESGITVARYREVVSQALDTLGYDQIDFYGMWGGGLVGLDMAVASPARVHRLVMSDLIYHDDATTADLKANYTPAWTPDWYGGHLLLCWHLMRDQAIFWPWYRRTREGIIWKEPYIDPQMIHGRVLEMFKAPVMWRLAYQAHFDYPTDAMLARVKVPTLLCSPNWDPNLPHTQQAHAAHPHCAFQILPDALEDWGPVIAEFCER